LIPCWNEPSITNNRPSANEIIYSLQPKKGMPHPIWQRSFFALAILSNLHGPCRFHVEIRLELLESETVVQQTDIFEVNLGNVPLRVQPVSIMIKAVQLPQPGVYHVALIWSNQELARATFHAR
jgi:hypothetical protein